MDCVSKINNILIISQAIGQKMLQILVKYFFGKVATPLNPISQIETESSTSVHEKEVEPRGLRIDDPNSDNIEEYHKRMVEENPSNPVVLGKYAQFLSKVRWMFVQEYIYMKLSFVIVTEMISFDAVPLNSIG